MNWTAFELEISNEIAHIRLNRPEKLNSFIPAMWEELPQLIQQIDNNAEARVIVISSTGKHFTAGMDLSVFASFEKNENVEQARANEAFKALVDTLQQTFTALTKVRQPVLAAIQGGCIGAGLDLITACDLRYATADAFFTLHEINIGMVADVGTFPRLQQLIPLGIAREMAFTGEPLNAERAEKIGLVNKVFDSHDELLEGVMAVAKTIAAKSPLAVSGSKSILNYGIDHGTNETLETIALQQAGLFSSSDIKKAITAQQGKKIAVFKNLAPKKGLK